MTRINNILVKAATIDGLNNDPVDPNLENSEVVDPSLEEGTVLDTTPETAEDTAVEETAKDDLLARIEAANAELERVLVENDEFLSDESRATIERLLATLRAEAAAIDGAGYGMGYNPETGEIEAVDYASRTSLPEMGSGWDGGIISEYQEDADRLEPEDGDYMGTIEIEASGDPMNPTAVMFSFDDAFEAEISEGGRIDNVDVVSRGRDLVVTASGTDAEGNEIRKSWVIREGTVRPEPIVFNFTTLSHGINFDASRAYRISDGSYNSYYGVTRGFYIHGTAYGDNIYGSQGDDAIVGWENYAEGTSANDDTVIDNIDGMAGNDRIYGDEDSEAFGSEGGRDIIRGGAGNDTLYGGGNIDTRYASDSIAAGSPGGVNQFERVADDTNLTLPDPSSWIDAPGWEATTDSSGMVTLSNTGDSTNNQLDITLPPGYSMAFGEVAPDGTSLLITFVGEDAEGNPQTCQLTVDDFMRGRTGFSPEDVLHLNVHGSDESNIIDFSKIRNLESQVINIFGHAGDDILLAPPSDRMTAGLSRDELLHSTGATSASIRDSIILDPNDENYFDAVIDETTDRIRITVGENTPPEDAMLSLVAPEGYTYGYLSRDPDNGNLLVIMVSPDTGDTLVVEIEGSTNIDYNEIEVVNTRVEDLDDALDDDGELDGNAISGPWTLIPITLGEDDYTVDSGAGSDLLFAPSGTNFVADSEDEIIEGTLQDGNGLDNAPVSDPNTPSG